ncbi:MAG: TonB-dependent receptor domain-containing protein [Pseudomonadota bacterium]
MKTTTALLLGSTALMAAGAALAQETSIPTDEIVVRGVNIPDEKRATSEISAVLDETSFDRTGDSDIAEALRRVTGISLSQGRFVIVRGLNERYSTVTINGSPLPSPEPLRRVVPLDIVPTSILSGSLVQKTFSPQFSAEFGGGLVELRTKGIPDESFFEFGGNIGIDLVTSGQNGLIHDGGKRDWLGFDDGTRNTPPLLFGNGAIPAAIQETVDVSIESDKTLLALENVIPPNWGVDTAFGSRFDLSDEVTLGATFAFGYSNEWQTRDGRREQGFRQSATSFDVDASQAYDFVSTTNTIETNGFATFGVELGDNHEITSTNFMLRSTSKDTRQSIGLDGNDPTGVEFLRTNLEFFERQVWQSQLAGDHVFPALSDLSVKWRGAYGEAFRDAPYQREYTYIRDLNVADSPFLYDATGQVGSTPHTLTFSKVEDQNIDAGIDFVLPLILAGTEVDLRAGYAYTDKERTTLNRNYEYVSQVAVPSLILGSRADQLFGPSVTGTPVFDLTFLGAAIDLDNSFSTLVVHGAYAGADIQVGPYIRLAAGGRYEDGEQVTNAFSTLTPTNVTQTVIAEDYFLPAATVTWNPLDDVQVRAGYSKTITRPQFRELTPAIFIDDATDLAYRGNPFLRDTRINNYDVRAEYYFGRGRFVTLGGFYKELDGPIEEAIDRDLGGFEFVSFINAPSAELYGFEFEFENTWAVSDIVDWGFVASKDLVFKTNYTYSKSTVSNEGNVSTSALNPLTRVVEEQVLPGASVFEDGRALQGQSKHLFNLQIGVEDPDKESKATFLVNWASSRIRQVELVLGANDIVPRVIEEPPVTVDFVWSRRFENIGGMWQVGLEVRNILGDDYKATQTFSDGSVTQYDVYPLGRKISASLKKEF